ncbi:MAG: hypothetical protein ACHP84_19945 [Caulobacterales bacterium]
MRRLADIFTAAFCLLSLPLFFLGSFGGVLAGLWMLIVSRWAEFGAAAAVLVGAVVFVCVLLPGLTLAMPGRGLLQQARAVLDTRLIVAGTQWNYVIMTVWCLGVFIFVLGQSRGHPVPPLLWAFPNAHGRWRRAARREARGAVAKPSLGGVFAAQLGCVAMMAGVLFLQAGWNIPGLAPYLVPFLAVAAAVQIVVLLALFRHVTSSSRAEVAAKVFE